MQYQPTKWAAVFLKTGIPVVISTVFGAMLALLLNRSLFHGAAQSFDAMLYIRSLWGLGQGDYFNPVMQQHCFAIHGHFMLLFLAPLTWIFPAAYVLIGAQASALSAIIFMGIRALNAEYIARSKAAAAVSVARMAVFGILLTLGSPIILNPFLFDLHPGLLGLPFITAGLLRRVARGQYDRVGLVSMGLSILAREEYALVVAAALLFGSYSHANDLSLRTKIISAVICVVYFVGYWLLARGVSMESAELLLAKDSGPKGEQALSAEFYWFKLMLFAAIGVSVGCWSLLGWRMLGAVVPGLLFLMANRWLVEGQLRYQYSMFVAPGLIAAAVLGFRRLERFKFVPRVLLYGLAVIVACGSFLIASAAPGGGQFQHVSFSIKDGEGQFAWNLSYDNRIEQAHQLLANIPEQNGLVVPYQFGAAVAERETIWPLFKLVAHLQQQKPVPNDIQSIVIFAGDYNTAGRYLIARENFHLAEAKGPLLHFQRTVIPAQSESRQYLLDSRPALE